MKRFIIFISIGLAIVIGLSLLAFYFNSTYKVTVNYDHIHDITITDTDDTQDSADQKPIRTINKTGQSFRVPNNASYIITYKGDDGYSDGTKAIDPSDTTITITPDFSKAKYQQLITSSSEAIKKVISTKYPTADSQYTISTYAMYERGKYALASLKYKGDYGENSDTLKIILENKSGKWQLLTKPDIVFNKYTYPNIPRSLLDTVNDTVIPE